VHGAVAEDAGVLLVKEIGDGAVVVGQRPLGVVGKAAPGGIEVVEEPSLQFGTGIGEGAQPLIMFVVIPAPDLGMRLGAGDLREKIPGQRAVEQGIVALVGVGEQAIVAGAQAFRFEVFQAVRLVMARHQGLAGHAGQGVPLHGEGAQDPVAALAGLVEEDAPAAALSDALRGELGGFQLVDPLDAAAQGVFQGGQGLLGKPEAVAAGVEEHDVHGVAHEEAHRLHPGGGGPLNIPIAPGKELPRIHVQEIARLPAVPPPMVHAVQGGRRRVNELQERLASLVGHHGRDAPLARPAGGGELEVGGYVVTVTHPFLFLAGDALPAAGIDVRGLEQSGVGVTIAGEAALAVVAYVHALVGVEVSAVAADLHLEEPLFQVGKDGLEAGHPVLGTLVVDEVLGAELGDGQEAGPRHVIAFPFPRDEGGKGQAGEVIAGKESLAGQVAVGVEVRFLVEPGAVLQ